MRRATISGDYPFSAQPLISFDDVLLAFFRDQGQAASVVRDRNAAHHLFPVFTERMMSDIQSSDLRRYIRKRQQSGASASTINKEIGLFSRAVRHAQRELGWALDNPAQGLKLREPEGRVRWLTRAQATTLVACAGQLGPRAAHLPDLITLALHTGMRKGELLGLEWARVDLENALVYLEARHTKSKRRRSIPLNAAGMGAVLSRQRMASSGWVFGGVKDVKHSFTHACQLAGIENFRFHDLRHTFASWLVQAGTPLVEVRDLLGHASIEMTERYAHLAPQRLRHAVQCLDDAA